MKRWQKGTAIAVVTLGLFGGYLYNIGEHYKIPAVAEHVVEKNQKLSNYEREYSISLAVNPKEKGSSAIDKLNNSVVHINERKENKERMVHYYLSTQGQDFEGDFFEDKKTVLFKSPMYHRHIIFDKEKGDSLQHKKSPDFNESFVNFLKENTSNMKIQKDVGANEENIRTVTLKIPKEKIGKQLETLIDSLQNGMPFEEILYHNERTTDKLLKTHKSQKDMIVNFNQRKKALQAGIQDVFKKSELLESTIILKMTDDELITEINVVFEFMYQEKVKIPFTIYMDMNTWNIGEMKVDPLDVDPTNTIPYSRMTDDIDYFENENLQMETKPEEDRSQTLEGFNENHQGLEENTSTLKDIGDDFIPVVPKEKEKSQQ